MGDDVWARVGWTAPGILAPDNAGRAVKHLAAYFAPSSTGHGDALTGASFNALCGGGDRTATADTITGDDILAVNSLAVTVPEIHALQLLGSGVTEQGKEATRAWRDGLGHDHTLRASDVPAAELIPIDPEAVSAALARVPATVDLAEVLPADVDRVLRNVDLLWRELRRKNFGQTMVSKLLARKRPRLLPVIDSIVARQLNHDRNTVSFYRNMWEVMSDRELKLPEHLTALRKTAAGRTGDERISQLTDLRVLDIVVWSEEKATPR